jgi:hypothetical protein
MRRRNFIAGLVSTTAAWPLGARAQQPTRMRRVGVRISTREGDALGQAHVDLLRREFGELGWVEDRNIRFDFRWIGGDAVRAKAAAAELVSQKSDVIIANSTLSLAAARGTRPAQYRSFSWLSAIPLDKASSLAWHTLTATLLGLVPSSSRSAESGWS